MHRLLRDAAKAVCIRLARCRCVAGGVVHERAVDIGEGDRDLHIQITSVKWRAHRGTLTGYASCVCTLWPPFWWPYRGKLIGFAGLFCR